MVIRKLASAHISMQTLNHTMCTLYNRRYHQVTTQSHIHHLARYYSHTHSEAVVNLPLPKQVSDGDGGSDFAGWVECATSLVALTLAAFWALAVPDVVTWGKHGEIV